MHRTKKPSTAIFAVLAIAALAATSAAAAPVATSTSNGLTAAGGPLAIHGYDAVSYFADGEPQRGRAELSTLHEGAVYRFASRDNLRAFVRNPERYAPEFGGFCAYGVSVGKKFDGDPEIWRIVNDKLYFNLNPDIRVTWEKDLQKNIDKADDNWQEIKDVPAESL